MEKKRVLGLELEVGDQISIQLLARRGFAGSTPQSTPHEASPLYSTRLALPLEPPHRLLLFLFALPRHPLLRKAWLALQILVLEL